MERKLPKSTAQIVKFFNDFIRKDKVVKFIIKTRAEFGIPPNGIPFEKIDRLCLSVEPEMFTFYIPFRLFPMVGKNYDKVIKSKTKLFNRCLSFVYQQEIESTFIFSMLGLYIIFNQTIPNFPIDRPDNDLMKLEYLPSRLSWYDENHKEIMYLTLPGESSTEPSELDSMYDYFSSISDKYPLALYINPHASQNQVTDFISKNWKYIESYRSDKQINFNKFRTKNKQEVNDFCYEHQDLTLKKIMSLVNKKFNADLDEGAIGKILSVERKRRN